jgi:hypothetical protein
MTIDNVPNFLSRMLTIVSRRLAWAWCGLHGHLILLHFEPHRLSLECALCGYASEGWEVGRPPAARHLADNRTHSNVRTERRHTLSGVPSGARMAS